MFVVDYPRDVIEMRGADARTYLHSQLSNDVLRLAVGESCWSFVLQPVGRIDVLARVWRTADDCFVLDTDAGFGEALVARLQRFKIRVKADIVPLDWRCLAVRGAGADTIDGVPSWGGGVDLLGERPVAPAGVEAGTPEQLLAARIDAVWPAMGAEIVPGDTIPAETGIVAQAVSFTKGCYPGQELVERMDSRGAQAPRSLQRVALPASEGVQVTSRCGDVGLAYVRRNASSAPQ